MSELGPDLLRTGVLLRSSDLLGFLMERAEDFRKGCRVKLNGKPIDIGLLEGSTELTGNNQVFLTVAVKPANA